MVILVVFNSFNVVKNLKKTDPVARQMPPLYTTRVIFYKSDKSTNKKYVCDSNFEMHLYYYMNLF